MGTTNPPCSYKEFTFTDLKGNYHIVEAVDFMAATTAMDLYLGPREYIHFPDKPESDDEKKNTTYYPIEGDLPRTDRCRGTPCACSDLIGDILK